MEDLLGSRMKMYEKVECGRRFIPLLPVIARIDGKAFHSFTKGFSKPIRNPDLEVVRRDVKELDLPRLTQVTNLIDVIFEGVPHES